MTLLGRRYGAALAGLAIVCTPIVASGQSVPVYQSGTLTLPGGLAKFWRDGQIGDAGNVLGDANGRGVLPFAVEDSLGPGVCANTAATGGDYRAFCLGHDADGNALLTVDSFGLSDQGAHIRINGQTYSIPGQGNGNVVGPLTTVVGNGMLWNSTDGTAAADAGGTFAPLIETNTVLKARSTASMPARVRRIGFYAAGDVPPLDYIASSSACGLNTGNGDDGSEVKSADNKCWLAVFPASGADIREWGVVADGGATDNSTALAASVAWAVANHGKLLLPPGLIGFETAQAWGASGASNWGIYGSGPASGFLYTGAGTTGDLIAIGSTSGSASQGLVFKNFRIASNTVMTTSAAFHLEQVGHTSLWNVDIDGQEGNGNLWNGLWCDQCDHVSSYEGQASAQNDGVEVNGGVGAGKFKADFWIIGGKISPANGKAMAVGIHIGGAFGGFHLIGDVTSAGTNVLVDNALADEVNREIFLEKGATIDSSAIGPNVEINDSHGGDLIQIAGWVASAATSNIDIKAMAGGVVSISSPFIFNAGTDGILVEDGDVVVDTSSATAIINNGGYGINCTAENAGINPGALPVGNSTASYSADCGAIQRTTYTPTVGCGSGTKSDITATGTYVVDRLRKIATFQAVITDTTNGSCATDLSITLPTTATEATVVAGQATVVSGSMLVGFVPSNSATMLIHNYDNTYPGADGETLIVSGTYQTQ
jgi:hypothetical protein